MEQPIGRVALRREGKWWCAYLSKTDTMDGAIMISKMRMNAAESEPKVKEAFINLNRLIVGDAIAETQGLAPTWKEPVAAPEDERNYAERAADDANLAIERAVTQPSAQHDQDARLKTEEGLRRQGNTSFHGAIDRAWLTWKMLAIAADADELHSRDCEMAFKAGTATLFWSIMKMLDPGEEPTDADLEKMADLSREIEDFTKTFDQRFVDRVRKAPP